MTPPHPAAPPAVSIHGLTVRLAGGGRTIVDDVSLTIAPGEVLGLVGESGSGKTTVGSALLGYVRKGAEIIAGSVTVDGTDVLALRGPALERYRGRAIGYMPQNPATALNPALRIGRQLGEVLAVHRPEIDADEQAAAVSAALEDVQLPGDPAFSRRFPHELSGGQQQRVCLAMAFLLRPRAIMLDEPTTGLDVTTQARVLEVVQGLCRAHDAAALYISHDLAVVAQLAERVAVMNRGRLVELGAAQQVLRAPTDPYTKALVAAIPDVTDHPERIVIPDRSGETHSTTSDLADRLATLQAGDTVITADNLRCSYGSTEVVGGVSFTIRGGECVAVVGESGSGKSTLSLALVGLVEPTAGSVAIAGVRLPPTARARSALARRTVQYIFQNPYASLNPRRTIGSTLVKAHRHFFGGSRRAALSAAARALARVGLPDRTLRQYPEQLSGGELQRVAIGRALICQPHVLVCDEVTSALDVSVQAQILDLLAGLKREHCLALLFVTHNLAVVRHLADRVAVMEHGRLVEVGETDAVLDAPAHPYTRSLLRDTPTFRAMSMPEAAGEPAASHGGRT